MSKLFDLNGGVETSPLKETDGMYVVSTDANGQPVNSGFVTLSGLKTSLELGTAAGATLTTSNSDTTVGRVLKVGNFGIGIPVTLMSSVDLDTLTTYGRYWVSSGGLANGPAGNAFGGIVKVNTITASGTERVLQDFTAYSGTQHGRRFYRVIRSDATWSPWYEYFSTRSVIPVENGGTNSDNASDARTNLGLGSVATQTVVTGNEDTATTRIPTVGWVQANTVSLVEVPATPTSSGVAGQIAVDNNYAYFCTDTDTWIRVEKDNTWV